ncbi:nitrate- and nitrite sensing domain-containing protein [Achromobacter sp. GG226]|uniref:nitrate- and nitrite sensing domain-containing protein n=1 Tax=Verticiella alkaliphila TaxID=2779529 RepID=UPI001C0DB9E0|nr:nitrate- and nitrite sensing domain-containing protein [Verticiella sp. GG226]MBU4610437.1 nitrate- and nitrite sensing domain-containing protein [Verticiella sp. GG226]
MTDDHLPLPLRYLLAARRSELRGLEELARTCELVGVTSQLVHALQKERGYANLYLGQPHTPLLNTLNGLTDAAQAHETHVRHCLQHVDPAAEHGPDQARLLSRVADVLYRLDELPRLRRRIRDQGVDGDSATQSFTRLIAALLSLVFEAADTALDPELTRTLVALFNLLQGKELSGQERACGTAGFSAGYFTDAQKAQLRHLGDAQERCFAVFAQHAGDDVLRAWTPIAADQSRVQPLRDIAWRTSPAQPVDPGLAQTWFDLLTERIDAMKTVDNLLVQTLLQRSQARLVQTRRELENHRVLSRRLAEQVDEPDLPRVFSLQEHVLDAAPQDGVGSQMARSLLDLVQTQAQRLQQVSHELDEARSSLAERKTVEQAKAWLIRHLRMTEAAAHERLQQAAMQSGRRLADVAQEILTEARKQR